MSTSHRVYIGPYVIAPNVTTLEPMNNIRTECTVSKDHSVPHHSNFCPHCGAPTAVVTGPMVRTKKPIILHNVDDKVEGVIWLPGCFDNIWLSNNTKRYGGRYFDSSDYGEIIDIPSDEDIAHEVDMMTTATNFIDELIETKYGVTLEIKYGIISFWN